MSDREPKYVTAPRPVNLRTAARARTQHEVRGNAAVRERHVMAQARARLGRPLVEQVRAHSPNTVARLRPLAAAALLLATGSSVAVLFALIQGLPVIAAAGSTGIIAGGLVAWRSRTARTRDASGDAVPLFDDGSLRALDRILAGMAPEISERIALQLVEFNRVIVRLASHGVVPVDGNFTMDDRLYITECVRRYLPDTLQAYLAVPRDRREATLLDENQSASDLLSQQLDMLRIELEARESRLARSAAGSLVRQQRFLQSKKTT